MIVCRAHTKLIPPPTHPYMVRVPSLNILGVTIRQDLQMGKHVDNLIISAAQNIFALKVLKAHGAKPEMLQAVCFATLINRLLYAAPAWRGFATSGDFLRIDAVVRRAKRWGVCDKNLPDINSLLDKREQIMFGAILDNPNHVLFNLLPPNRNFPYSLRPRFHNRTLPTKTSLSIKNFLNRLLYSSLSL